MKPVETALDSILNEKFYEDRQEAAGDRRICKLVSWSKLQHYTVHFGGKNCSLIKMKQICLAV